MGNFFLFLFYQHNKATSISTRQYEDSTRISYRYAKCRYTECRGANTISNNRKGECRSQKMKE
jgi:hypothetical protein